MSTQHSTTELQLVSTQHSVAGLGLVSTQYSTTGLQLVRTQQSASVLQLVSTQPSVSEYTLDTGSISHRDISTLGVLRTKTKCSYGYLVCCHDNGC